MKIRKNDLIKLQKEWYEKLSKLGFKDIEKIKGGDLVLIERANHCYRRTNHITRALKEEYFRWMSQEVNDSNAVFRNEADRYILTRFSEGAMIKEIVKELRTKGMSRDRNTIRFIIRRYEMEWGFRIWSDKELHIKKKA